ncbi:MAG TPA: Hsp20/alpha crystallin family protein [Bacteroidia bacterium]|jgi:HSP20 family protein|nr:Hsp20/alpha crystallin family protein [Bacteroidia bacterium]
MSQLVKKNRVTFPLIVDDFLNSRGLLPGLFYDDSSLFNDNVFAIPSANIIEDEKSYKIEVAAPGLERKDFKVEIDNNILTINAEREDEKNDSGKNYKRKEFSYSSFSRSFGLPENSVPDKIEAKYDNGILRLSIPKKEASLLKPSKEIKVS